MIGNLSLEFYIMYWSVHAEGIPSGKVSGKRLNIEHSK